MEEDLKCAPRLPGCGTQHPHRALGGTRVLLAAAPTTPPCFRRWRRSSLLQRKNYFYFRASGASADAPLSLFHGRGFRSKFHVLGRKSQTFKQSAQKDGAKFGGGELDRFREKKFEKQNDELKRVIAAK